MSGRKKETLTTVIKKKNNNNFEPTIPVDTITPTEDHLQLTEVDATKSIDSTKGKINEISSELTTITTDVGALDRSDYLKLNPGNINDNEFLDLAAKVISKYVEDNIKNSISNAVNALAVVNDNILYYGEKLDSISNDTGMLVEQNNDIRRNTTMINNSLAEIASNDNNMIVKLDEINKKVDELSSRESVTGMVIDDTVVVKQLTDQIVELKTEANTFFIGMKQKYDNQLAEINSARENEVSRLSIEKNKAQNEKKNLQSQINNFKIEKRKLIEDKEKNRLLWEQAKKENQQLVQYATANVQAIESAANLTIKTNQNQIIEYDERLEKLSNDIKNKAEEYNRNISEKEQQITELQTKLNETQSGFQLIIQSNENEIEKLKTEKASIETEKNNLLQIVNTTEGNENQLLLENSTKITTLINEKAQITQKLKDKELEYQNMVNENNRNIDLYNVMRDEKTKLERNVVYYELSNNEYQISEFGIVTGDEKLIYVDNPGELIKNYNVITKQLASLNTNVNELNVINEKFELRPSQLNMNNVGIVQPTINVKKLLDAYNRLNSPQKGGGGEGGGQSLEPIVGGGGKGKGGGENILSVYNPPWKLLGTSLKSTAFIRQETTFKGFVDTMESKGSYELSITFLTKIDDQFVTQQVLTHTSTYFISSDNTPQSINRGTFYANFKENDNIVATYNTLMPKLVWHEGYIQYSIKIGKDYFLLPTIPEAYKIDMTKIEGNLALEVKVTEKLSLAVVSVPPLMAILENVMVYI